MAPPHEPTITNLAVRGALPIGLSGRLLSIGPHDDADHAGPRPPGADEGVVHSVHLDVGRAVSYRSRPVVTDAVAQRLGLTPSPGPPSAGVDVIAGNIVVFGGSILALGDGSLAYELTSDLDTVRRVDLAGQCRPLAAHPKRDPITGDLHVLATDTTGQQTHVVVSSHAFTRTSRPIAPPAITDLAITRDRVVFVTDGFVAAAAHTGEADVEWVSTGTNNPSLVHAHDAGEVVVLYAVTPSLERWTLRTAPASVQREVLDPTPQHFAHADELSVHGPPRHLWATGDRTVYKHDLLTANRDHRTVQAGCRPGDFVFVADAARPDQTDGGWLVGFVQHEHTLETDLVVLDAADFAQPPIATIHIPRRIPRRLRSTWIPDRTITDNEGDRT